ncbi:putative O-glycosylation ligase, exosortase A system-associated [Catenovulum sp. SM1970]|uniref:putative O-glycosylation ligase, exosortase A system-associated n=1 Tax=Marinifaba aquimaris TaxID=2741323 RepID=UPI001572ECAD|nr:putative O-glycosylation ligase, exosortase A system-associated [Marinifaba aquimaris]NTS78290.1 putative O-glycosylation ligase, exosortase A system-associated [Marinifaba aquimaris]
MITDLFLASIMCIFFFYGWTRPHVALSAVIWVDTLKPQTTSFSFLAGKPLSLIFTLFFFTVLFLNLKKVKIPKSKNYIFLILFFMFWITLATVHAEYQVVAWLKYDVVIKTLLFTFFIPFVVSTRQHLELFISVLIISFGLFITMAGVKSAMGGGGYGVSLIGLGGFMYGEGSTLATLAICVLPLIHFMLKYSTLIKERPRFKYVLYFYIFCCLMVLIGTQARTGLVALGVYVILLLVQSKQKFKTLLIILIVPLLIKPFVTDDWLNRMNTIDEGATTEKSALGRIVVWRWTFDYVADKPFLGGGFFSYNANAGILHLYQQGEEIEIRQKGAKAFHNIYIEVLGETGYVGLAIFMCIIFQSLLANRSTINYHKKNKTKNSEWAIPFSRNISQSLIIYCAGGMFIGVAFYPWMYYLHALSVAMKHIEDE